MPTFRLTAKALDDLKSIGRYTRNTWSREQRNAYLAKLDRCFHAPARVPLGGRTCDEIREGYRKFHVGRHLVFYREGAHGIEIVRILYYCVNLESHFPDD